MLFVVAQPTNGPKSPDGDGYVQTEPVPAGRSDGLYLPEDRRQSGGLSDDPTESGEPVRNRHPHGPLTGGR